jgi:hypothetical protein
MNYTFYCFSLRKVAKDITFAIVTNISSLNSTAFATDNNTVQSI